MGTIISRPNREIDVTFAEGITTNSEEIIKLINVNVFETTLDETIEITFNGEVIVLVIEDECRYTPIDIYFLNKEGAQQSLTFFKAQTQSMDVTRETFESDRGQPIDSFHQFIDFNIQGRTSFKVNSGFVDESLNEDFKQLLLSSRVYIYDGLNIIPINVSQNNIEYKSRAKDRLINYEISFKYSYNEINNV